MSAFADQELKRLWWLVMLFGLAVGLIGMFFVASPHETLSTFTVIAGIFLLVDGVLAVIASIFSRGEGRGLLALVGVLSGIAGLVLIKKPFESLVVFVLIFGVWFIVAGVARFIGAFAEPEGRGKHRHRDPRRPRRHRHPLLARSQSCDARGDNRHRDDLPRCPLHRRRLGAASTRARRGQRTSGASSDATGDLTGANGRAEERT